MSTRITVTIPDTIALQRVIANLYKVGITEAQIDFPPSEKPDTTELFDAPTENAGLFDAPTENAGLFDDDAMTETKEVVVPPVTRDVLRTAIDGASVLDEPVLTEKLRTSLLDLWAPIATTVASTEAVEVDDGGCMPMDIEGDDYWFGPRDAECVA